MERYAKSISELEKLYPKGILIEARVTQIKPFGVVVRVDRGIKGIIRRREMSWESEPEAPQNIVSKGQRVKVRVLGVDHTIPRLKLSLRQAEKDPWQTVNQQYKVGQVVSCTVTGLLHKGAFLELEPAMTGYVPIHEICEPAPAQIEDVLWHGDTVEAIITRVDADERHIELSIKRRLAVLERQREAAFRNTYLKHEKEGWSSLGESLSDEARRALLHFLQQHEQPSKQPYESSINGQAVIVEKLNRILLADDDPSFRISLQLLLQRLGHKVTAVDNALKAVALCEQQKFDMILMDLGLTTKGEEGINAVPNMLAIDENLPVIIITALGIASNYAQIVNDLKAAGVRGLLLKPVDISKLYALMTAIIEGRDGMGVKTFIQAVEENGVKHDYVPGHLVLHGNAMEAIHKELEELEQQTWASTVVIFRLPEAGHEVTVLSYVGLPLTGYDANKYTLEATPVSEVIREGKEIFETAVAHNPQKFQYLNLLNFTSCIGVPASTLGRTEYGLFLFHQQEAHFTELHLLQARASAKLIGSIIAREEAEALVQRVQPIVFAGQIGSALIHEMNNRLGSIVNYTKSLKVEHEAIETDLTRAVDPFLRKKIRGYIDELENNNKAVEKLIVTFMGLMNKERRELVNINDLIHRARTVLAPIAESEKVNIFLQLEKELPSTLTVGVWLEQIFVNIALNAIQNIRLVRDGGEMLIQSRFAGQQEALPLQIRFTDTGPGIHGQHAAHIFELGFSTRPEGTGLGLFTAMRLMRSLRGRISIEKSVMLVGTTFLIELPLVVPSV